MRKLAQIGILLCIVCNTVFAAPFVEVGIGASTGGCVYKGLERAGAFIEETCSNNPLGSVVVGYIFGKTGFTVEAEHWSSLVDEKDRGTEMVSIKYRKTFND